MTQFYSRNDTAYNGDVYSIPFSYVKKDEIRVYIDNELFTDWQFLNDSQIQLISVPEEVTSETIVSVRRITDISEPIVEYTNNTMLSKEALNLSQNQLLNAVQEVYDNNIQFNLDTLDLIGDNKSEIEAEFDAFTSQTNSTIAQNKSEIEAEFDAFTNDINSTIEQVTEAAEKLDALDAAVAEATAQAELATQKADETAEALDEATTSMNQKLSNAQQAAENATEQAELAAEKVEEAEEVIAAVTPTLTQEIADRIADTNRLQEQINYLQLKATGVFSEYLNFLRAGSTHTALKIGENVSLKFKLGTEECLYSNSADDEFDVISKLDTGDSLTAGKDYFVYLKKLAASATGFDFVVSRNATYPDNHTADEVYQIGGFHTLCLGVTAANAPALKTGSFWSTHPAIGYNTADIIPNSVWCLTHRPISSPAGMVYVDRRGKWFDIYLQSGTFSGTASVFGGTTTDTRQPILHQFDLICVFKTMMSDSDFMTAAEGSNQQTAIQGAADAVTTGGHYDTAGKRMCSGYFLEDCCGFLWQWLDEIAPVGGSGWNGYGTNADQRGQHYGSMPYVLLAGGGWSCSSSCGSWSRLGAAVRSNVFANIGCRGVSRSLFIGKVA